MERQNTANRIKTSLIPDIKKAIRALAKTPPEDSSLKTVIRQILPEIHEARMAGRSFDDIADSLKAFGLKVTGSTLSSYFRDEMRTNAEPTAGHEAQNSSDSAKAWGAAEIEESPETTSVPSAMVSEYIADEKDDPDQTNVEPSANKIPMMADPSRHQLEEEMASLLAGIMEDDQRQE